MRVDPSGFIEQVFEAGARDPVLDGLLLAGLPLVLLVALLGRSVVTEALAVGYILVFVIYVGYLAVAD